MEADKRSKQELLQRITELESALERNCAVDETFLLKLLCRNNISVYEWFIDSDALKWDEKMYEYWEVSVEEGMTKNKFFSGIHEDDRADVQQAIENLLIVGGVDNYSIQFRVIGIETGKEKWIEQTGQIYLDSNTSSKIVVIARDVTESKRAQITLENIKSNYALHEIILDENGKPFDYRFLDLNSAFEEAIGMKASDVIGKTALELFPETESYWIEKFGKVARTGISVNYENYSVELSKWFDVKVFSPQKGQFALLGMDITDRKLVEGRLKESEEKFRAFVETSSDWFWEIDLNGTYIYSSPAGYKILGYRPEELIGKSAFEFMSEEEAEKVHDKYAYYVDNKLPFALLENVTLHKDGYPVILESSGIPILDNKGALIGYRGIDRDVTERNKKEHAVKELEYIYQKLIENSPLGMHFYKLNKDEQLIFEGANLAANQLLGVDNSIFIGKTIGDAFPSLMQTEVPERYYEAAKNGTPWQTEQIAYAEDVISGAYEVTAFQTKPGSMVAVFDDITERKKSDLALSQSEQLFRLLADNSTDMIARHDANGVFIYVSPACRFLVGYEPEELIGHNAFDYFHPEDLKKLEENRLKIIDQPINSTITFRFRCKDGDYIWLESNTRTIFDENTGNVVELHASSRDVSERVLAEQKIREQNDALKELNASKDKFVAILAHDLRSPLSSLLGLLEVMQVQISTFSIDEISDYISLAYDSANKLFTLLDDILIWASSQAGRIPFNPKEIDFISIANDIIDILRSNANSKDIAINTSFDLHVKMIADVDMVKTVLRNLMSNAIKFTDNGGVVDVKVTQNANETIICVADNGVGIREELKEKLFDISSSFSTPGTRNEQGTGLGLLLCKEFVDRHNGKIWLESEIGKGTTFYFTIPIKNKIN